MLPMWDAIPTTFQTGIGLLIVGAGPLDRIVPKGLGISEQRLGLSALAGGRPDVVSRRTLSFWSLEPPDEPKGQASGGRF